MTSAFSFDGAVAIERTVPRAAKCRSADIVLDYEIDACAVWIAEGHNQKVALQFPDELLADAAEVAAALGKRTGAQVFVLADTSYGSCCVDEVAAEHCRADCLIHYGAACLTPTTGRLPVKYVFQPLPVDPSHCSSSLRDVVGDTERPLVLLYDVEFSHASDAVAEALGRHFRTVIKSLLVLQPAAADGTASGRVTVLSRCFELPGHSVQAAADAAVAADGGDPLSRCSLVVLTGDEDGSPLLTGILLRLGAAAAGVYSYCPVTRTCLCEAGSGGAVGRVPLNKRLARRYRLIERARDARIVGIVVGTLGVDGYLAAIDRLKELVHKAGKKSYTFVVGKLNPAKLANFLEVDIFVLVACPQNSLLDLSGFYRPIVTPYEMETACNPERPWGTRYAVDYRSLLPGGDDYVALPEQLSETTDVSLVTGAMRRCGSTSQEADRGESDAATGATVAQLPPVGDLQVAHGSAGALATRTAATTAGKRAVLSALDALQPSCHVTTIADVPAGTFTCAQFVDRAQRSGGSFLGEFLLQRSWHGLEQHLGQTEVVKATIGQRGIASSYEHEASPS